MFVLGAFLVGYYLGAKAEEGSVGELVDSLRSIATSEEARTLVGSALGMAGELARTLASDGRAGDVMERVTGRGLRAV